LVYIELETEASMIKLVYCIRKRPALSDEEFSRYWKDVHGHIGARIPGLRRLVQSHAVTIPGDPKRPDFNGMAELWFDGIDSLLSARQSPEWSASSQDEANFIDADSTALFVTREFEIPLPRA
jgi:uncharacterized protein (TIGR02118 family)